MATVSFKLGSGPFGAGASVGIYPRSAFPNGPQTGQAPPVAALQTVTVPATVSGLESSTAYVAMAEVGGVWQYVNFIAEGASGEQVLSLAGSGVVDGVLQVVTPGTAVHLPALAAGKVAKSIALQALETNLNPVVVGSSTVVAAVGTHAAPTRRGTALSQLGVFGADLSDPTQLFIDAISAADGVSYTIITA